MQSFDLGGGTTPTADNSSSNIKDGTIQTFREDVLQASLESVVLVDFWAPWCGPCKQLTPVLEKIVSNANGSVKLVKINIDENQAIAAQMNIQSIPAVYAFKGGRPVDGFMGALPESEIVAFIEKVGGDLGGAQREQYLEAAKSAFDQGDLAGAAQIYASLLQETPEDAECIAGLARCYMESGDLDQARQTLTLAPAAINEKPEIVAARAALDLLEKSSSLGDIAPLQEKLAANSQDHDTRLELALAFNARNMRQEAVDELIEIVRQDRSWNEEAARKQLVELFDAWGATDQNTIYGRRKLSAILFS